MRYLNVLLLLVVFGGTIGLFYLLGPEEKSSLFYFNLGFTLFLEAVFFGTGVAIAGEKLFNIHNFAVAYQVKLYVIIAAVIMIAYNLTAKFAGIEIIDPKWYFGLLILLTIIFTVIIIIVGQAAQHQIKHSEQIVQKAQHQKDLKKDFMRLERSFYEVAQKMTKSSPMLDEVKSNIRKMENSINMIPISLLARRAEDAEMVSLKLAEVQQELEKLDPNADDEANQAVLNSLLSKTKRVIDEINILKSV